MRANQRKNAHLFNLCSCLFQMKIFYYCLLFTSFTGRRIDLVDKRPQNKNSELAPFQSFQTEKVLSKMLELWSSVTVRKRKSHYLLLLYVNYFIPTNQPVHMPSSMRGSIKRKCILTWPKCNLCTLQMQLTECVGNTLGERKPFPSLLGNAAFLNPGSIRCSEGF